MSEPIFEYRTVVGRLTAEFGAREAATTFEEKINDYANDGYYLDQIVSSPHNNGTFVLITMRRDVVS